jgi:hypothetical protein
MALAFAVIGGAVAFSGISGPPVAALPPDLLTGSL